MLVVTHAQALKIENDPPCMLREAHIHTFVNIEAVEILVVTGAQCPKRVDFSHYKPGWVAQETLTKQQVITLLKQTTRPIVLELSDHHYSPLLPFKVSSATSKVRKRKQFEGANSNMAIDLDAIN
jgi:hypothetical protein